MSKIAHISIEKFPTLLFCCINLYWEMYPMTGPNMMTNNNRKITNIEYDHSDNLIKFNINIKINSYKISFIK
jgi:hypothetical protein